MKREACLYALNPLKATMVEYDSKTTVSVNGAEVVVGGSEAKDMENKADKSKQYIEKDEYMQFAEKYFTDLKLNDDDTDDFWRPANTWKIKNDEIGTYARSPDATYTEEVKGKEVRADLGDDYDFEQVTVDGEKVDAYYVDGELTELPTKSGSTFAIEKNNDDAKVGGNGVLTEVYNIDGDDDNDDTVRIVSIKTWLAEVSGDYDEDDEELELVDVDEDDVPSLGIDSDEYTLSSDDFANLDAFEDEDYVLVTIAKGEIKSIAKAEKVTGTVTNYEVGDSITADGTKYEYSKTYDDDNSDNDDWGDNLSIDDDYDLYLDAYGYVIFYDGVEDDGKYVYIDDFFAASNSTKSTVKANAYFLDGTNEEISIDKVNGDSVKGQDDADALMEDNDADKGWYTYTTSSDKYKLTKKSSGVEVSGVLTDKDTVFIMGGPAKGTSSTVFVVVDDDDDVSVYTGIKKVPEITVNDAATGDKAYISIVFEKNSSNYAKYVFIDLGDVATSKGGDKTGDVVFLYKDKYDKKGTDADENVYYSYKAVLNGEVTKVKFDEDNGTLGVGLFTEVEYDNNGYVTKFTDVSTDGYEYNTGREDIEDWTAQTDVGDGDMKTVSAKKLASDYEALAVYGVLNGNDEFTYLFVQSTVYN